MATHHSIKLVEYTLVYCVESGTEEVSAMYRPVRMLAAGIAIALVLCFVSGASFARAGTLDGAKLALHVQGHQIKQAFICGSALPTMAGCHSAQNQSTLVTHGKPEHHL